MFGSPVLFFGRREEVSGDANFEERPRRVGSTILIDFWVRTQSSVWGGNVARFVDDLLRRCSEDRQMRPALVKCAYVVALLSIAVPR